VSSKVERCQSPIMRLQDPSDRRGVTLLELLCAIAIIAVLLGLVLGAVAMTQSRATKLTTYVEKGQESIEKMQGPAGLLSPD
jgi:prepilin-type N-terminal cleavage/methylation domain-containing protein